MKFNMISLIASSDQAFAFRALITVYFYIKSVVYTLFYKSPFCKNHEAQNMQKKQEYHKNNVQIQII